MTKNMKLVIVESPTKAKTISRFLGKGFYVESSYGHIRDLPSYKLGVNIENDFDPQYVIPRRSRPVIKKLKELCKKSERIILATDEDREGEAIAWHLIEALGLGKEPKKSPKTAKTTKKTQKIESIIERIAFHEITQKAIQEALNNPRALNVNLVNAQQARRILDRLVGYKLSPFLWKKVMRGLSAGRVQSVALRLVCEREDEIRAFKSRKYWAIEVKLQKKDCLSETKPTCMAFNGNLSIINGKIIPEPGITDEKEAQKITSDLKNSDLRLASIKKKTQERSPRPPFTTSTLQQEAWSRLRYSAKKTMLIAQQLYEGVDIRGEGSTGLITYMRTDSLNVSEDALKKAREFLLSSYGDTYSLEKPRVFKTKSKRAQEAHEAIRPTDPGLAPEKIKSDLTQDQYRLYNLVWKRFLASQMPNAIFNQIIMTIEASNPGENIYKIRSSGSVLKFDGYMKLNPSGAEDVILPELTEGDQLKALEVNSIEKQTQAPPRFTEASLIKILEKFGIGRPSTYAPIMSTIQERGYAFKNENKYLTPTEIGEKVNKMLVEHFPKIVDIDFTALMEEEFDRIADGEKEWKTVLKDFYDPFAKNLEEKYETVKKEVMAQETGEMCPECGKPLVIRYSRYGKFIACSGYPDCKFTKIIPPEPLGIKCPKCNEGDIVERRTRKRRVFYGCSKYPDCSFATWQRPTGELCPKCKNALVQMKNHVKCSNKECGLQITESDKKEDPLN